MSYLLHGLGVSPGVAVGPVFLLDAGERTERTAGNVDQEKTAYREAVEEAAAALRELGASLGERGMQAEAGIMEAQALMLVDPGFEAMVLADIESGTPADQAVASAGEHFAAAFEALDDLYMAARGADVRDVAQRVITTLSGTPTSPELERPSIVVAHELTPSQTAGFDSTLVLGIATETGSVTSHTAILASALGIPAVVGVADITSRVAMGMRAALDGATGEVMLEPSTREQGLFAARGEEQSRVRARLQADRDLPAETSDGRAIVLAANIGSPADLPAAQQAGADGVGLFRTEFLFAGRSTMPSEDEQHDAYRTVLEGMAPHRVVVRTLDVGGDKPLPYLPMRPEANPFLGERGIRYTLRHPDLLTTQLRALMRAAPAGSLSIMLPMITNLAEVEAVRLILQGLHLPRPDTLELGIMIEIPAVAVLADRFSRGVDFVSVGTNDLTQYALAVDRGNDAVAPLYESLHPGVLRLLHHSVEGAHAHGRWAGVCGEMAGDPVAIPILLGLGFDELSMTPSRIPAARECIRSVSHAICEYVAREAIKLESAHQVEALVRQRLQL